jgi:hypothetical protein
MPYLLALVFALSPAARAAEPVWYRPWSSAKELAEILRSVPEGRALAESAAKADAHYLERIRPGEASFTENSVSGTYEPLREESLATTESARITLKRALPLSDAAADLAHELLHFTRRHPVDPYAPEFHAGAYVRRGIEGEGGELRAFEKECEVAWALEKRYPAFPRHRLCASYRKEGRFDLEKARKGYYAVGTWFAKAGPALKEALPELSAAAPVFTSGLSGNPYPRSLAEEYEGVRRRACEVNRWKYRRAAAAANARKGLVPHGTREEIRAFEAFHEAHCRPPAK